MTMKVTRTAVRWSSYGLAVAVAIVAQRGAASAAQVCVSMANSGGAVAGMQVDISWDKSCVEATAGRGTSAGCTASPANGKQANSRLMDSSIRVLLFATDNVDPIPDGELFCCAFKQPDNPCCSLQLSKLIASDPGGQRISDPNLTFVATMDGNACAQLGVGGAGSTGTSPARGNLGSRPQQPPVVAQGGNTGDAGVPAAQQPAQAAPQQQANAAPQAGAAGGPIGVPPPTSPREMAQVPAAEVPQAGQAAPGVVEAPAAAGAQAVGQAEPAAAATATAAAAASPQGAAATPVVAAPTPTEAVPTVTKTIPAPTATPTAKGGFLSGCNMR